MHRIFSCAPGKYVLVISVSDGTSTRERVIRLPFEAKSLSEQSPVAAAVIPLATSDGITATEPAVAAFGGSIPFARNSRIAVSGRGSAATNWKFTLRRRGVDDEQGEEVSSLTLTPATILPSATAGDSAGVLREFPLRAIPEAEGSLFIFDMPYESLDPGVYKLEVAAAENGRSDTLRHTLRVYWKDMPLSFQDPVFALSAMRHILTEDEMEQIGKGPEDRLSERLHAWWKLKDPTPATARNEMLEEYFRRVDAAYYAYQTLSQPNGALTDRGKIHVLYGPPVETRRQLIPGEPAQEVWLYPSMNRTFVFADREKNGNYKLLSQ